MTNITEPKVLTTISRSEQLDAHKKKLGCNYVSAVDLVRKIYPPWDPEKTPLHASFLNWLELLNDADYTKFCEECHEQFDAHLVTEHINPAVQPQENSDEEAKKD